MKISANLENYLKPVMESAISLLAGFLAGGIIIWIAGFNPILFYEALIAGAFGDLYSTLNTLSYSTPLILTALSFAIAARASLFNIGAEGQMYFGVLAAVAIGAFIPLPPVLHQLSIMALAILLGGIWGAVAGWLRVSRGVNEVVSTIMMNFLALYLVNYLATYVFYDPLQAYKTKSILSSAELPIIVPGTDLSLAFPLSIITALIFYLLLWRTPLGYEIRAVGLNPSAAKYGGIDVRRTMVVSMFLSGAAAALAGAFEVMGRFYYTDTGLSIVKNMGFDGIAVSLVGRNHPIGIILSSIFFAMLKTGIQAVQRSTSVGGRTGVPLELGLVVQGIIIIFVSIPEILRLIQGIRRREV